MWALVIAGFSGCSIYDPEERVPAYIQVDSASFITNSGTGFNTSNITEVWLFVNNQSVGIYSIPTGKIPVLAEGNATISVSPGVFTDGVTANKVLYPFYSQYSIQTKLEKSKLTKIKPTFGYGSDVYIPFKFYQDFETSDTGIITSGRGTVSLTRSTITDPALETQYGKRFGRFTTQNDADIIDFSSVAYLPMRQNGMPVYLEFDYQSTCQVVVGVTGLNAKQPYHDLVLRPKDTWTKIYVSLSDETQNFGSGEKFRFYFSSVSAPGANQSFMIDNIRLIYF